MKSWKICKERALAHQLVRAIHLERCNPDYQLKYPSEHRDNPKCETRRECHKEAKIRILKQHAINLKFYGRPAVVRPERLSRNA